MTDTPMTPEATTPSGVSWAALITGLLSIVAILVFAFTSAGVAVLWAAAIFGLAAVILGIVGLAKGQPKAQAVIGLIAGGLSLLFAGGLFVFALLFIGAFMNG